MELLIAVFIGLMFACGVYLILRRSIVKVILGIFVLTNATNLIIFLGGGLTKTMVAFVPEGEVTIEPSLINDPLAQVLVIKAIVIGLGIAAYILALKYRYFEVTGTHDLDHLKNTDQR